MIRWRASWNVGRSASPMASHCAGGQRLGADHQRVERDQRRGGGPGSCAVYASVASTTTSARTDAGRRRHPAPARRPRPTCRCAAARPALDGGAGEGVGEAQRVDRGAVRREQRGRACRAAGRRAASSSSVSQRRSSVAEAEGPGLVELGRQPGVLGRRAGERDGAALVEAGVVGRAGGEAADLVDGRRASPAGRRSPRRARARAASAAGSWPAAPSTTRRCGRWRRSRRRARSSTAMRSAGSRCASDSAVHSPV